MTSYALPLPADPDASRADRHCDGRVPQLLQLGRFARQSARRGERRHGLRVEDVIGRQSYSRRWRNRRCSAQHTDGVMRRRVGWLFMQLLGLSRPVASIRHYGRRGATARASPCPRPGDARQYRASAPRTAPGPRALGAYCVQAHRAWRIAGLTVADHNCAVFALLAVG